jgi:hypothetical protein
MASIGNFDAPCRLAGIEAAARSEIQAPVAVQAPWSRSDA